MDFRVNNDRMYFQVRYGRKSVETLEAKIFEITEEDLLRAGLDDSPSVLRNYANAPCDPLEKILSKEGYALATERECLTFLRSGKKAGVKGLRGLNLWHWSEEDCQLSFYDYSFGSPTSDYSIMDEYDEATFVTVLGVRSVTPEQSGLS